MYDPPHLLKNIRNNLKKSGFSCNGVESSWSYKESLFLFDRKNRYRMAPKLIYRHIYLPSFASLRVRFAAQFLSHTVAAGLSTLVESTSCLRKQRRQPPLQKTSTSLSMLLTALLGKPFKECGMASWQLPATKNFCYTFSHG